MFRSVGLTEDQLKTVMDYFLTFREAPQITSKNCFEMAKAIYAVMDDRLNPADLHSPEARYMISLGIRIAAWEAQAA